MKKLVFFMLCLLWMGPYEYAESRPIVENPKTREMSGFTFDTVQFFNGCKETTFDNLRVGLTREEVQRTMKCQKLAPPYNDLMGSYDLDLDDQGNKVQYHPGWEPSMPAHDLYVIKGKLSMVAYDKDGKVSDLMDHRKLDELR